MLLGIELGPTPSLDDPQATGHAHLAVSNFSHPLLDKFFECKAAQWDAFELPELVVGRTIPIFMAPAKTYSTLLVIQ